MSTKIKTRAAWLTLALSGLVVGWAGSQLSTSNLSAASAVTPAVNTAGSSNAVTPEGRHVTLAPVEKGKGAMKSINAAIAEQTAAGRKPNILVIFGDDIGVPQISAYTMGMMGYRTPNIDRIAH
ncbi:MAG TPA: hypothetical protein VGG73_07705, partial [Vicinamibacterales bacterium]